MLEDLEGRLSWEKKPDGIVVHIPSRRGSMFLLFGPVIAVWLMFVAARFSYTVGPNTTPEDIQTAVIWFIVAGVGVSFIILLFWAAWAFTSESILTLDQTAIKIQHRILGIEVLMQTYPTADAHNFRFIPPGGYSTTRTVVDPRTSKIQFKAGTKSCTFAAGVTSMEALILMERMQEVYKFPDFEKPRR